jgi:hypothetical protein
MLVPIHVDSSKLRDSTHEAFAIRPTDRRQDLYAPVGDSSIVGEPPIPSQPSLSNRPVITSLPPDTDTARSLPLGRTRTRLASHHPRADRDQFTTNPRTIPAEPPPRQCRPTPVHSHSQKKISTRPRNPARIRPDDVIEANRRGGPWGPAFRRFSTLGTDSLRVPAERFLHFCNRSLPIPCQTHPGEGGSSRVGSNPSTRRVPPPPGQEEPGQNGREDFSSLIKIIRRNRLPVLTKSGNRRLYPVGSQRRRLDSMAADRRRSLSMYGANRRVLTRSSAGEYACRWPFWNPSPETTAGSDAQTVLEGACNVLADLVIGTRSAAASMADFGHAETVAWQSGYFERHARPRYE